MERKIQLYGGPLDGAMIDESKVKNGEYRLTRRRDNYAIKTTDNKNEYHDYWLIAGTGWVGEGHATYKMRGGRLCHRDWPDAMNKAT